jgi:hypothetical protein
VGNLETRDDVTLLASIVRFTKVLLVGLVAHEERVLSRSPAAQRT